MSEESGVTREQAEALRAELERDAKEHGYHLNSDRDFTRDLSEGLLVNERRFGYRSCPCRLASGEAAADLDIVCPCDYRDPDLEEWGACYCALYVSQEVLDGTRELTPVPERRPVDGPRRSSAPAPGEKRPQGPSPGVAVWRCRVCGYLCAREAPPERCPICKASKERFETFWK